jgi:hypothetical protein
LLWLSSQLVATIDATKDDVDADDGEQALDPPDPLAASLRAIRAELVRRQDEAEDAAWAQQFAGDPEILLAKKLERWWVRLQSGPPSPASQTPEDRECAVEALEDYARALFAIACAIERDERHRADIAAGIERRPRPPTRVRMPDALGLEPRPKSADSNGKSRKLSRTELHLLKLEEEALSRQAAMRAAQSPGQQPQMETLVKIGRVERYDSRSMTGSVAIMGPGGRIELPFSMSNIMRAGITSLSPGQELECTIKKRPDGAMLVEEIKLSVGARAAALAELEHRAETAETNYKLFGRRLH